MTEKQDCLCARFYGRVQGVGFRFFAQEKAQMLGLKGWVKNQEDESVGLEAFGSREKLEKLLEELKKPVGLIRVERVEAKFCEKQSNEKGFRVSF
jgi:acylphosphatase